MYPNTFKSIFKENLYYLAHRIIWLLLLFPSVSIRIGILKIFGAKISNNVSILSGVKIIEPWRLCIGEHTTINSNVLLDCRGEVSIGSFTMIGRETSIHSVGHSYKDKLFKYYKGKVYVGNNVIIYPNVFIGPKIYIAEGTVVLPNSWVQKSTELNDVVAGVPAKKVNTNTTNSYKSHFNPSIFGI
jgi:putative colanic acid biosynthesis acetyltransferase WcaF